MLHLIFNTGAETKGAISQLGAVALEKSEARQSAATQFLRLIQHIPKSITTQ